MQPRRLPLQQRQHLVDHGFGDCRPGAAAAAAAEAYTNGVVTPHASFLALRYAPRAALDNLAKLRAHFGVYGKGGFYDAVNVAQRPGRPLLPRTRPGHGHGRAGNALSGDRCAGSSRAERSSSASARCWRWSSSPRAEGRGPPASAPPGTALRWRWWSRKAHRGEGPLVVCGRAIACVCPSSAPFLCAVRACFVTGAWLRAV